MSSSIVYIFQYLFGSETGYLCLGRIKRPGKGYKQEFFRYPEILEDIDEWVQDYQGYDLYFCPHLLFNPRRKKEEAGTSQIVWADLDDCSPDKLGKYGEPLPNIIIQTSQSHYQAYWKLKLARTPAVIEDLNHRIYEAYKLQGCDSCWALTHMMRLPYTLNHKREKPFKMKTIVDWGFCSRKALDGKLPALTTNKSQIKAIDTSEKPFCKFNAKQMRMYERHIWFDPIPQGKRSERIFELVKLAVNQLQCNDSGVIKLLMEHPVLIDKFPNKKDRCDDITRCLMKLRI
ncbi:MAG: hypothetical protein WB588_03065 [Dehalococcoidia bacterium]